MSSNDAKLQSDAQRLAALMMRKRELEEQIARHEIRNERVLVLFTKANIDRMQKMADLMGTSRNDLLNKLVEHAYLTGLFREPLKTDEGTTTKVSPRRGVSGLKKPGAENSAGSAPKKTASKTAAKAPATKPAANKNSQAKRPSRAKKQSKKPASSVK